MKVVLVLPCQTNISVDQKVLTFALREGKVVVTNALSKMERLFDKQSTITQEKHWTRVTLPAFSNPTRKVPTLRRENLSKLMYHPKGVVKVGAILLNTLLKLVWVTVRVFLKTRMVLLVTHKVFELHKSKIILGARTLPPHQRQF